MDSLEQSVLSLLNLNEEGLLWMVQGLLSGTLWMLGEFADVPIDGDEEEMNDLMELLAY